MILLKDLINLLEIQYPKETAEYWDTPGFTHKSKSRKEINKIFFCLDLSAKAFEEVEKNNPDLIITHHPFYFEETLEKEFSINPYKINIISKLKTLDISLYSLHTNYDNNEFGTSYQITKNLKYFKWLKTSSNYVSLVKVKDSIQNIISNIKSTFNFDKLITNKNFSKNDLNLEREYKIAFFAGAGDLELIIKIYNEVKFDFLVTSDLKWNSFVTLNSLGISYFLVSHKIEEIFMKDLANQIKNKDSSIEIIEFSLSLSTYFI